MNIKSIWSLALCAGFAMVGCTDKGDPSLTSGVNDEADDQDDDPDTSGTPVTTTLDPDTGDSMTSGATEVSSTGSVDPDSETGMMFLLEPDGGGVAFECDLFAQVCPEGEKCMPWGNDGGTWNATRCSPIDDNPGQPGDECSVEGGAASGIDTCDLGSMCWDVDPKTNMGICIAMCSGDESNPICEDPDTTCSIANDGAIVLCLPSCDPIVQDCAEGQACYPVADDWVCGPDASGEMGGYGDACEFINVCDPGLMCLDASATPGCVGAGGCCTEVCDLSDPTGDAQCTGAPEGQTCTPWYEEGTAPPGYEEVGACTLPA